MLKIAICDDDENLCSELKQHINHICPALNTKAETSVYTSGESLCMALTEGSCFNLIFLDIEFENMNGVQVGSKIRNEYNDEHTQIVYISRKSEYALELFDINPLNFLIKPLELEKVKKVIRKYFKSNGKKIIIYIKDKTDEFYGSLEEIYNTQVSKYDFLFIHKSYIVNYDYVHVFEYERLFLSDKTELPIGQSRRKDIRKRQSELLKKRF